MVQNVLDIFNILYIYYYYRKTHEIEEESEELLVHSIHECLKKPDEIA